MLPHFAPPPATVTLQELPGDHTTLSLTVRRREKLGVHCLSRAPCDRDVCSMHRATGNRNCIQTFNSKTPQYDNHLEH